jgi:hypothetical protein
MSILQAAITGFAIPVRLVAWAGTVPGLDVALLGNRTMGIFQAAYARPFKGMRGPIRALHRDLFVATVTAIAPTQGQQPERSEKQTSQPENRTFHSTNLTLSERDSTLLRAQSQGEVREKMR